MLGLQPHNLVIAGGEVSAVKVLSRPSLCSVEEKEVCRDDDDGFKFVTSARLIGPSFLLFWHQCQSVNFFFFFRKSKLHVCQIFTQSAVARSHSGVCASSTCTYKIHELSL